MTRKLLLVVTLAAVGLPVCAAESGNADHIAQLIEQLGSMKFPEREAAGKQLDALGAAALDALKKAVTSEDAEVRRRTGELVVRIERRVEMARLLEPTKVRFSCKDIPVREAVAEFSKRTGQPFMFIGDAPALANRKLTLDTGETSYWQAFDKLCNEARIAEVGEVPGTPSIPKLVPYLNVTEEVGPRPTHYAGAARIRVLPSKAVGFDQGKRAGEIVLTLGISLERQLTLEKVTGVRILRAVDGQGEGLTQIAGGLDTGMVPHPVVIVNGLATSPKIVIPSDVQAPIKLKSGTQPSNRLKELTGVLTVRLRTPPEPVMTVDNVLKTAANPVDGKDGGRLTVLEAERQANGEVKLRVEMQPPTAAAVGPFPGKQMQVAAVVIGPGGAVVFTPVHAPQLKLMDAKGVEFPAPRMSAHRVSIINNVWIHELTLHFQPQAGQAEPAKLQYVAPRSVTVDIPFQLTDVPLP